MVRTPSQLAAAIFQKKSQPHCRFCLAWVQEIGNEVDNRMASQQAS